MASIVTRQPETSRSSSSLGMAVISLLFPSTTTCPRLMWLAVAQALTMWMADLESALSKLWRSVLPSMATNCPAVTSCSEVTQESRHRSNSAGLIALKRALKRSCEGMPPVMSRNRASQARFWRPQVAMVTKSSAPAMTAHRAMVTMLMSGWVTLRRRGSVRLAKCVLIWAEGSSDMGAGHPEYVGDPVAGPVLDITDDRHVSIIPNYPSWRNRPGHRDKYPAYI